VTWQLQIGTIPLPVTCKTTKAHQWFAGRASSDTQVSKESEKEKIPY